MASVLDYVIREDGTLKSALEKLNDASGKQLVVVNAGNKVVGMVGNGDVRRAALHGALLSSPLVDHANTRFISVREDGIPGLKRLFTEHYISTIPITDAGGRLTKIALVLPPEYHVEIFEYARSKRRPDKKKASR